jgi:hypothetical protein
MESVHESVHRFPHHWSPPVFFPPAHWTTGANAKQRRGVVLEANPAPDEFKAAIIRSAWTDGGREHDVARILPSGAASAWAAECIDRRSEQYVNRVFHRPTASKQISNDFSLN